MIELLLNQTDIDVNKKSIIKSPMVEDHDLSEKTPLYHAIEIKNFEIIKCLFSKKDININELCIDEYYNKIYYYFGAPALIKAFFIGNNEIFNFLLQSIKRRN